MFTIAGAALRDTLTTFLSLTVFVGMLVMCFLLQGLGGFGGYVGGVLGFAYRFFEGGQVTLEERFGNGYVGSLMGLPLGLIGGAAIYYAHANWPTIQALFQGTAMAAAP